MKKKNNTKLISIIQSASYLLRVTDDSNNRSMKRQINDELKFLKQEAKKLKRL